MTEGPAPPHGKRSTYVAGCRCTECRAATAAYARDYKRRKSELAEVIEPEPLRPPEQTLNGEELDRFEWQILRLLCEQGRYYSSIALAADMYGTAEEIEFDRVLEWNLVELLLADLNEKGFVTYRFAKLKSGSAGPDEVNEPTEVIAHISPTRLAYDRTHQKYQWIRIAGSRTSRHDKPIRSPGDRTDYRTHGERAQGVGPVKTEDFIDHCVECNHLDNHRPQLIELYGSDDI